MTIQEVVQALQEEKRQGVCSRFPCRAIMVTSIDQYCELLEALQEIDGCEMVSTEVLFSSADVMPNYERLKEDTYRDKWVILAGVSEYLRLFSKKEASDGRFSSLWHYQASATNEGRIIIPLWGCEAQWFDEALHFNNDDRQQDFYYDCKNDDEEPVMDLLVLSDKFEQDFSKLEVLQRHPSIGLREWFAYWQEPESNITSFVLLTRRSRNVTTMGGSITVHVNNDMLSFIREHMAGAEKLDDRNCTEEMQHELITYALKGSTLDDALLEILNMTRFSGKDIMGRWRAMSDSHRRFVALWLKLHPENTYLCRCFEAAESVADVALQVGHRIFDLRADRPEWVDEYKALAAVMQLKPDGAYFAAVDEIAEYEARLDFLTNGTQDERRYMLRMVGEWLRKDPLQFYASERLAAVYPELAAYLRRDGQDDAIGAYMSGYKAYKLGNRLPDDEALYFNGVQTDGYEHRYAALSRSAGENTVVLWIDALGVEWLPLLAWSIGAHCEGSVREAAVTLADLPTETRFNDQWHAMDVPYEKLDMLDKLAHKGVIDEPDYYACIENQIDFVARVHERVSELMGRYQRVIITGDHGTSRLAARFFHTRDGIAAPSGATVYSHGRYCALDGATAPMLPHTVVAKDDDGRHYVVFANYDHFKQSGFAAGADDDRAIYGEVHGGATPEERLVPVIVVDSHREIPLMARWASSSVKIRRKKATFEIVFNKAVSQLIVKMDGVQGVASMKGADASVWQVEFANVKAGQYTSEVFADMHVLTLPEVTVRAALGDGFGDLP